MTDAVVVDEAHEAGVLHACRLGAHRRPQHPLGKRYVVGEFDGVGPLGDGPDQRNRLLRVAAGAQVGLELVELLVEVGSGEPVAERVEDVVGGLAGVVEPRELAAEHGGVEQRRPDRSDGGERSRSVDRDAARRRRPCRSGTRSTTGAPRRCPGRSSRIAGCPRPSPLVRDGRPCWDCTTPRLRWRTRW